MKGEHVVFSSGKDNWQTPGTLFDELNEEFNFTLDGAADETNHLLPRWLGPGSPIATDALTHDWARERLFVNPPYTMVKQFIRKGYEARGVALSVFLVPSRTDTKWWHDYVWDLRTNTWREGVKGRFVKGRIRFINPDGALRAPTASVIAGRHAPNNSAPFPSAIIVFGGLNA